MEVATRRLQRGNKLPLLSLVLDKNLPTVGELVMAEGIVGVLGRGEQGRELFLRCVWLRACLEAMHVRMPHDGFVCGMRREGVVVVMPRVLFVPRVVGNAGRMGRQRCGDIVCERGLELAVMIFVTAICLGVGESILELLLVLLPLVVVQLEAREILRRIVRAV